ncbi:MAG: GTPase, partial [Candidatus Phytoplasma australasiaticum]|nr:GTPase [Candidatus Phytoplasma australasiaticum]
MKKTFKEMDQSLKMIDLMLVILDARIPYSSVNWELLKTFNNKPFLLLLNKISLADMSKINIFKNFFEKNKIPVLWIDAKSKINIHQIKPYIYKILKIKKPFWEHKILKLMITGIPNVGKSTLINCLANKKIVKTANIPGITKQMHWEDMCYPKSEGGVGFRSLYDVSKALFCKLWWNFRTSTSLWSSFIWIKYCKKDHPV